jgi:hypothetical protein
MTQAARGGRVDRHVAQRLSQPHGGSTQQGGSARIRSGHTTQAAGVRRLSRQDCLYVRR